MKIVQIVPGSGGTFYCENCLRDSSLAKAFRALGHDAVLVPMYLPVFTDEPEIGRDTPVFFGGINVYLQQKFSLFRKTPRWLDRLFDSRWLLNLAAKRADVRVPHVIYYDEKDVWTRRLFPINQIAVTGILGESGRGEPETD